MNVIHRFPPFCAFQTCTFLEHSAENYAPYLVVTFSSYPCSLELTKLRDWEIFLSTAACHINLDTFVIIYIIHSLTIFRLKMRYLRLNLIHLSFVVQYIFILSFRLLPVLQISAEPVIMKSNLTFFLSYGCIEIDFTLKYGGGIYVVTSAMSRKF